jgi:hypothetical protein
MKEEKFSIIRFPIGVPFHGEKEYKRGLIYWCYKYIKHFILYKVNIKLYHRTHKQKFLEQFDSNFNEWTMYKMFIKGYYLDPYGIDRSESDGQSIFLNSD